MVHKHRSHTIFHAFPRGVTSFVNSRNHFFTWWKFSNSQSNEKIKFEMDQTKFMYETLTMKIVSWFEITRVFGKM